MKTLEVLRQRPPLFFNLAGISISDFDDLVANTYTVWHKSEQDSVSYKGRKRVIGAGRTHHLLFEA